MNVKISRPAGSNASFSMAAFVLALPLVALFYSSSAPATAAFSRQTGDPCSACHMQSYGPYLTPYGRLFKLNAFTAGHAAKLPDALNGFTFEANASFTHTKGAQAGGAADGFSGNNNVVNDWNGIFFTGRVTDRTGAYLQLNFNPQVEQNIDLRRNKHRWREACRRSVR